MVRLMATGRFLLMFILVMVIVLYSLFAAPVITAFNKKLYDEYTVKAAFLYNFAKFVEWPKEEVADASRPFNICILGEDPFGDTLNTINEKVVRGRKIVVQRYPAIEDMRECHIVFISASEKNNLPGILKKTRDLNILTVSDMDGFAREGGIINLMTENNKIQLEVNLEAAQRSGLRISSKLLNIASVIHGKDH